MDSTSLLSADHQQPMSLPPAPASKPNRIPVATLNRILNGKAADVVQTHYFGRVLTSNEVTYLNDPTKRNFPLYGKTSDASGEYEIAHIISALVVRPKSVSPSAEQTVGISGSEPRRRADSVAPPAVAKPPGVEVVKTPSLAKSIFKVIGMIVLVLLIFVVLHGAGLVL